MHKRASAETTDMLCNSLAKSCLPDALTLRLRGAFTAEFPDKLAIFESPAAKEATCGRLCWREAKFWRF